MQLPVTLRSKASPLLSGALSAAHLLVFAGLLACGLSVASMLGIGSLLAISLVFTLRTQRAHPAWSAMTLLADGQLEMERGDGGRHGAELLAGSTAFPWLVILRLQVEGRHLSLTLLPDGLEGDGHRLLRLWLRWRAMSV
ncbi:MAG: hypothetical protein OEL88_09705 [Sterolibacteriaceae bacterium MAG5]|nr:hypothetical protein [Candidatus Nitricoxidireducens bremensis]